MVNRNIYKIQSPPFGMDMEHDDYTHAEVFITSADQASFRRFANLLRSVVPRGSSSEEAFNAESWLDVENFYRTVNSAEATFRDPYNEWSLLWRLGMDWLDDLCYATNGGELGGDDLRKFRDRIAETKLHLPTQEELEKLLPSAKSDKGDLLQAWHESLRARHAKLLTLLDRAIELRTSVTIIF